MLNGWLWDGVGEGSWSWSLKPMVAHTVELESPEVVEVAHMFALESLDVVELAQRLVFESPEAVVLGLEGRTFQASIEVGCEGARL